MKTIKYENKEKILDLINSILWERTWINIDLFKYSDWVRYWIFDKDIIYNIFINNARHSVDEYTFLNWATRSAFIEFYNDEFLFSYDLWIEWFHYSEMNEEDKNKYDNIDYYFYYISWTGNTEIKITISNDWKNLEIVLKQKVADHTWSTTSEREEDKIHIYNSNLIY